ncbi:REP element-mobilizing transposase RayT [Acidaminobacter hydrogenoformans DSM 2784]|uniref:REP element-mobilizing transposase RayT n=1 Tax=Acidaminobacter hydrogenoformans DSM 2784 TaxID=1120920 RepID=A0A1G5S1L1_9FIRM|nr:REP element-mobilizing transposase RayT [Acidaminobacter hydrogenoformans DSM 2784]
MIMRGNNRRWIYQNDQEKERCIRLIEEQNREGLIGTAAWCVMDNHVHLIVKAQKEQLTQAFKKINTRFAMGYNQRESTCGHVFQDRFKSQCIEDKHYLMKAIRYIHCNPVKAGIVKHPQDYKWSSFSNFVFEEKAIDKDQHDFVMDLFNGDLAAFGEFHRMEDDAEHLEIDEDRSKIREENARRIITDYCEKCGVAETCQLQAFPEVMMALLKDLIEKSHLPYRAIASLTGVSFSRVRNAAKKESKRTVPND